MSNHTQNVKWSNDELTKVIGEYHKHRSAGLYQKSALEEAQQVLHENRRKTIHTNFLWEFNKLYNAKLAAKELPTLASPEQISNLRANASRVDWTEEERELLAMAWVEARTTNPFEAPGTLFEQVQRSLLDGSRQRSLPSLKSDPKLYERICTLWKEITLKAEPPPPRIIEIPVEQPINFMEIAQRLDFPSLMALVFDKASKQFANVKIEVPAPKPETNGHSPISLIQAATPPPQEKKKTRVAFCCVDAPILSKVQTEVEHSKIEIDLRLVDFASRTPTIPYSADYIVMTQRVVGSKGWDMARTTWPKSKIFIVGNHVHDAVQKMRDIASMQPPSVVVVAK